MAFADALTIAALGMSVVFAGLLLTALLIITINRAPDLARAWRQRRAGPQHPPEPARTTPPLDPQIVTVIATVLEIDQRLHRAEHGARLTISRR